jgi:hypothetical protein
LNRNKTGKKFFESLDIHPHTYTHLQSDISPILIPHPQSEIEIEIESEIEIEIEREIERER